MSKQTILPVHSEDVPYMEQFGFLRDGELNVTKYRIPALAALGENKLVACCEARMDGHSDWGHIDLIVRRSLDGGRSWSRPDAIPPVHGSSGCTVNNPVWIVDDATGVLHLVHCINYDRCFHRISQDGGVTFSQPIEITETFRGFDGAFPWKLLATGPGHGIRMRSGRLLIPVWMSTGGESGTEHWPSCSSVIYSDDEGKSWHAGEVAVRNSEPWLNPSECAVVERNDGSVLLNVRTESSNRRRLLMVSGDGATAWSPPRFHPDLHEPVCMGGMVRHPDGQLLFSIPACRTLNLEVPHSDSFSYREDLTVAVSFDDGLSWPVSRCLHPGPSSYSDLAVLPDGKIVCLYESGDGLMVARFNLCWLMETHAMPTR